MTEIKIALLRGINVGKAKRVAMADLRELVAELGFTEVRTLLNSGNVVFRGAGTSAQAAVAIQKSLAARLGVSTAVIVITAEELARAVAGNPLLDRVDNFSRFFVAVLASASDVDRLAPLAERDWSPESLALGPRVAYIWCPEGLTKSAASTAVNRELGDAVTARNWNTMTKLLALAESLDRAQDGG